MRGSAQLKTNAVPSSKVKDHSLQAIDFAGGRLPAGKTGATGAEGPRGGGGAPGADGTNGTNGANGVPGVNGAPGANGIGLNGFFGSGGDGDMTVAVHAALVQDTYFQNLTLAPAATLDTAGYRLFVSGTLTLGDGSKIGRDGNPGNQGFGGAALPAGSLGGGGAGGGNACGPPPDSMTNSLGGNGGGANCAVGGSATRPTPAVGGPGILDAATAAVAGRSLDDSAVTGGAGGRGGNFNGGGGGGGVVVVVSTSPQPAGVTLIATGGPGPNAGSPGFTEWLN